MLVKEFKCPYCQCLGKKEVKKYSTKYHGNRIL